MDPKLPHLGSVSIRSGPFRGGIGGERIGDRDRRPPAPPQAYRIAAAPRAYIIKVKATKHEPAT